PGPGQVLIKVAGCGLCHSDFTMRKLPRPIGEQLGWSMPFTLGHETAGWIAALGPGVSGFALDDAVALTASTSCGSCRFCLRGMDNLCPASMTGRGYGRDGGLAEYVLVDNPRGLLKLGSLDPRTAGPLTDAGATAYHAVKRVLPRLLPGGTAVVIGAGGLGAFAIQFLKVLSAAEVVAADTNQARLAYAESLGARTGAIKRADAVLDFVGTHQTIAEGMAAVRPGGAFGLIGSGGGKLDKPWFGALPRDGEVFTFQGATIADAQEVIQLARSGSIRNDVEQFGFDEIDAAYARLAAGGLTGRAVIVPS
ncbi:MAG: alcohol dehydrogenase catalytic domain-containing protein, partial [Dehalococcoidia bacterium]